MTKALLRVSARNVELSLLDGFAVGGMKPLMYLRLRVQKGFTYERAGC